MRDKIIAALAGKCVNDTAAKQAAKDCVRIAEGFAADIVVDTVRKMSQNHFGFAEWTSQNAVWRKSKRRWKAKSDEGWVYYSSAEMYRFYLESLTARKGA